MRRSPLPFRHRYNAVRKKLIQNIGVESHEAANFEEGDAALINETPNEPGPDSQIIRSLVHIKRLPVQSNSGCAHKIADLLLNGRSSAEPSPFWTPIRGDLGYPTVAGSELVLGRPGTQNSDQR
jgi:hypothetical protein